MKLIRFTTDMGRSLGRSSVWFTPKSVVLVCPADFDDNQTLIKLDTGNDVRVVEISEDVVSKINAALNDDGALPPVFR